LSKKDEKFPPNPPSTDLCQQIVSNFCANTSPEVFDQAIGYSVGKIDVFLENF